MCVCVWAGELGELINGNYFNHLLVDSMDKVAKLPSSLAQSTLFRHEYCNYNAPMRARTHAQMYTEVLCVRVREREMHCGALESVCDEPGVLMPRKFDTLGKTAGTHNNAPSWC